MTAPIPDIEASEWYYDALDALESFATLEEGDEDGALLHGEGEIQNPDDDIGRAVEDLEALTDSA